MVFTDDNNVVRTSYKPTVKLFSCHELNCERRVYTILTDTFKTQQAIG